MDEREGKARAEVRVIEGKVAEMGTAGSNGFGRNGAVEVYREHVGALRRHMENTSAYLRKEVKGVEAKIEEAR